MYYYIESAIPFLAVVKQPENFEHHVVVCVGRNQVKLEDLKKQVVRKGEIFLEGTEQSSGEIQYEQRHRDIYIADCADACRGYVVNDDGQPPYSILGIQEKSKDDEKDVKKIEWEIGHPYSNIICLCVPLHKRFFLEAKSAREAFRQILVGELGYRQILNKKIKIYH